MARSATVSARGGREAGHSWERAVDLRSMQLVALKGQLVGKGTGQTRQVLAPPRSPDHSTYHAFLLLEAPKGTAAHRTAAWCKRQRGRAIS